LAQKDAWIYLSIDLSVLGSQQFSGSIAQEKLSFKEEIIDNFWKKSLGCSPLLAGAYSIT